eukprot:9490973-Pyramimonas_sp.AAC.1
MAAFAKLLRLKREPSAGAGVTGSYDLFSGDEPGGGSNSSAAKGRIKGQYNRVLNRKNKIVRDAAGNEAAMVRRRVYVVDPCPAGERVCECTDDTAVDAPTTPTTPTSPPRCSAFAGTATEPNGGGAASCRITRARWAGCASPWRWTLPRRRSPRRPRPRYSSSTAVTAWRWTSLSRTFGAAGRRP